MITLDRPIPKTLTAGSVLRTGARILKSRIYPDNETFVVLCEKTPGNQTELVTWRANGLGECFWGHYHCNDEDGAMKDFLSR